MSLSLAYVIFFFGTAFLALYMAMKSNDSYVKAGLVFFALIMVYFSSGMLMAISAYMGIPILIDIFSDAGLFISILLFMLLAVLFIQLITFVYEKLFKTTVGH